MPRRTAEASKAIRKAWEKEQKLVLSGKGTRDWTKEQQQSIIDVGIAYDDEGKAFEGQHMKSVEAYPEYQGEADNIQFLTRQEHLDAHGGNWNNPTNWYYNPNTKQRIDFGEGPFVAPVTIDLSTPVCVAGKTDDTVPKNADEERSVPNLESNETVNVPKRIDMDENPAEPSTTRGNMRKTLPVERSNWLTGVGQGLRGIAKKGRETAVNAWTFVRNNPEIIPAAIAIIHSGAKLVRSFSSQGQVSGGSNDYSEEGTDRFASEDDLFTDDDTNSEDSIDDGIEEETSGERQGSPKAPHRRKGFPRRYKSGKEVWVKPTIVHPDEYTGEDDT